MEIPFTTFCFRFVVIEMTRNYPSLLGLCRHSSFRCTFVRVISCDFVDRIFETEKARSTKTHEPTRTETDRQSEF